MASTTTWRSKLGNEYDRAMIEAYDKKAKDEIDRLRRLPDNKLCADCFQGPTVWASVNLGVFLCMRCGSHHRGIGTHISLPKGCTGTYLWGPCEVEQMRSIGNKRANQIYGCGSESERPGPDASDAAWKQFLVEKYEKKRFMPAQHHTKTTEPTTSSPCDKTDVVLPVDALSPPEAVDLMTFAEMPKHTAGADHPKGKKQGQQVDFFADFGL